MQFLNYLLNYRSHKVWKRTHILKIVSNKKGAYIWFLYDLDPEVNMLSRLVAKQAGSSDLKGSCLNHALTHLGVDEADMTIFPEAATEDSP